MSDRFLAAVLRRLFNSALSALVLFATASAVSAAGDSYTMQGDDLIVTVDSRWAGCGQGGYWPIRVRVTNRGPQRVLTFRFESPNYQNIPSVEQTRPVDQNATAQFTLSVPMVGHGNSGYLSVYDRRGRIESMQRRHLGLGDADFGPFERPALLVISPQSVDCQRFEDAVNSIGHGAMSSGRHAYYGSSRSSDHQVLEPAAMLPEKWIDYTGLDLVAVALDTFAGLPSQNRRAIMEWVHQGGTLLVYNVGEPVNQSQQLARTLDLDNYSSASPKWQPARVDNRNPVKPVLVDEHGNLMGVEEAFDVEENEPQIQPNVDPGQFVWSDGQNAFLARRLMLGTVFAFQEDPFPGSPHDWAWLLNTLGSDRFQWSGRHGVSARRENDEFLHFLVPGIKGVPVPAFIGLITMFTIVIGPLNYFFCWRRKQFYLLVVSIPLIALVTSLSLFGYTAVAHGFGTKSRVRSVTFLDQQHKKAVTSARVSLYAGLAPSRGLKFSPTTAVYTIWPENGRFESGRVNWSETQALESGFLRSRTRTQFLTVEHRDERGRLEVNPPADGKVQVVNGLEWDVEALLLADAGGILYFTGELPAGASTRLGRAEPQDLEAVAALLKEHPLQPPPGASSGNRHGWFGFGRRYPYYGRQGPVGRFNQNLAERSLREFSSLSTGEAGNALQPHSYLAVLKQNPNVQTGVESSQERTSLHVLIGHYAARGEGVKE